MVRSGRAIMVHSASNEQGLAFKVHEHDWIPTDVDGFTLMLRPDRSTPPTDDSRPRGKGWSNASKRRRFNR